ncbi:hypothetical protein CY35_14G038900 [Sphagnum magellanicum]|nr:hypothetical protein CY35_14G038900 [Sphagnum magellanicum]KAH9541043.1 hypothetical protein CY35_14G038900 [Sphagnum magellanicum]
MYNGIGLTTPRGSGTNGYIQTNKFFVKPRPVRVEIREYENGQGAGGVSRKANKEILEHDRKRQVELKLTELEDQLVEQGYPDDEVLERVEAFRKVLQASVSATEDGTSSASALGDAKVSSTQSHHVAAQKEKKLDNMRAALKLGDVKEGEAFDRDLQEQRKQERMLAWEEKDRERHEKQAAIEEEERRKEKERQRAAKDRKREEEEEERKQRRQERKARHEKEEEQRRLEKLAKKRSNRDGERDHDHR